MVCSARAGRAHWPPCGPPQCALLAVAAERFDDGGVDFGGGECVAGGDVREAHQHMPARSDPPHTRRNRVEDYKFDGLNETIRPVNSKLKVAGSRAPLHLLEARSKKIDGERVYHYTRSNQATPASLAQCGHSNFGSVR
jgi:hypothetical protein